MQRTTRAQRRLMTHGISFAMMLLVIPTVAAGATVDDASKAELDTATEHYENGITAMDAEKYADALAHFQKSYATVNSPNSRMMVGRALAKLGNFAAAYRELSKTLKQATELALTQKKYKKTVATVQKELDEIKDKLAFVSVRQGAKLQLAGETIPVADWQDAQPVMPGAVDVEVTFADGRTERKQLTLKPGERFELSVDAPPPAAVVPVAASGASARTATDQERGTSGLSRKTVGYVVGAVGVVGVGAFVGLALIAAPSYGDTKSGCVAQVCPESGIDNAASKATLQGLGYAGLGIGVVGLGVGTWLVLTGKSNAANTALQVGPAGVHLRGRF